MSVHSPIVAVYRGSAMINVSKFAELKQHLLRSGSNTSGRTLQNPSRDM